MRISLQNCLCRPALRGRELAPQQVGHAAVEVAQPAVDRQLECRAWTPGASVADTPSVRAMMTKSLWPRSSAALRIIFSLPTNSSAEIRALPAMWPQRLGITWSSRCAAATPASHVQLDRALDVEEVPVAGVHVDDDRRDLEMDGGHPLVGVAHRHRQLELAQRAHRAARAVGDLDRRVEVHVGGAEVADGERVAAEVDGVEAVVHDELGAHGVVDARAEDVGLASASRRRRRLLGSSLRDAGTLKPSGSRGVETRSIEASFSVVATPSSVYSFSWSQLQGSGHSHSWRRRLGFEVAMVCSM